MKTACTTVPVSGFALLCLITSIVGCAHNRPTDPGQWVSLRPEIGEYFDFSSDECQELYTEYQANIQEYNKDYNSQGQIPEKQYEEQLMAISIKDDRLSRKICKECPRTEKGKRLFHCMPSSSIPWYIKK